MKRWWLDMRFEIAFVVALCFALYGNTLWNQFALDDGLVLTDNKYVQAGVSGIPDILLHDSFHGAIGEAGALTGGRYRPLELIVFALEKEVFGNSPAVFHFFSVFYFTMACVVMLALLRQHLLHGKPVLSFVAVALFVLHPIHTEVVANVKSRDEILSLLFLLITLWGMLLGSQTLKVWPRTVAIASYLLALLSKENGLIFVIVIPLTLWFFSRQNAKQALVQSVPYWTVAGVYLLGRLAVVGFHQQQVHQVMDMPYALATTAQKYGTILFVLLKYLLLLVFPYPLTYDYSFNQIPYRGFMDGAVIVSLLIHLALVGCAVALTRKREILAYCIWFYLLSLFLVSNLAVNIGAPLGERFLFQPSFAFCVGLSVLGAKVLEPGSAGIPAGSSEFSELAGKDAGAPRRVGQFQGSKARKLSANSLTIVGGASGREGASRMRILLVSAVLAPLCAAQAVWTISRNRVWRTGSQLALHDVAVSSNSARANTFAAVNLIKLSDSASDTAEKEKLLKQAVSYCEKSAAISPDYIDTYIDLGVAYSKLEDVDAAAAAWKRAAALSPQDGRVLTDFKWVSEKYLASGLQAGANDAARAADYFQRALQFDESNPEIWYNLGGARFTLKQYDAARTNWTQALQLNPHDERARQGMQALDAIQKR